MEAKQSDLNANVIAALDIGSNSFHLIVARLIDGSLQILHKVKQSIRLADGLSADDILDQAAIDRGLACLSQISQTLKSVNPENVRIVATFTLRKARNSKDFITQAKKVFPYPIEIIPGKEEARLIYQGIAHTVADLGNRLVIDIGGGSTEFIVGSGFTPLKLSSHSMGCVSYTKLFFKDGKISEKAFKKAIISAKQELEDIADTYKELTWKNCIGTSGTIKAIREALIQNNISTDGSIKLEHLQKLKQTLISFENTELVKIAGISEQRNLVLAGGLAILIAAFELLQIEKMQYEDAALREGVLYEMEKRFQHSDIRERTIESLSSRYAIDVKQAARVTRSSQFIYEQVKKEWQLNPKDSYFLLITWAAKLHEIGLHIHSTGYHKHSSYILQYTDMPGFNQEEQNVLSTLVRFHRKKLKIDELPNFLLFKENKIIKLIRILRIASILNLRRRQDYLPQYKTIINNDKIALEFPAGFLDKESLLVADLESEQLMQSEAGFEFSFS